MKRLAVITTSLLLALTAFGGTVSALADGETSETSYPKNEAFIKTLTFTDLADYEIDNGVYYFLDGEELIRFENGERIVDESEDFEFTPSQKEVSTEDYYYYFDKSDKLTVYAKETKDEPTTFAGNFTNLKQFGTTVYAVKNNVLYSFDGTKDPAPITLRYMDYSVADGISVGQTATALTNYGGLTFVTVKKGSYMTEVDLKDLSGPDFIQGETKTADSDKTALLLCYTGSSAAVVSIGDSSYVLHKDSIETNTAAKQLCTQEPEFAHATITGNRIYASPFTVTGTTLLPNATSTIVDVKCKLVCAGDYEGVLNSVYYEVEYGPQENRQTGYVAYGFLTEYIIEDDKEPNTEKDPNYSEKNNVTTVLLILAVVVLVLIAIGYIIYTVISDKRKGKKETPEKKQTKKVKNSK